MRHPLALALQLPLLVDGLRMMRARALVKGKGDGSCESKGDGTCEGTRVARNEVYGEAHCEGAEDGGAVGGTLCTNGIPP